MAHLDLIDWNAAALRVVEQTRAPVYAGPRLKGGPSTRSTQGKRASDAEHRRRRGIRGLNEELSRYYQLGVNQSLWGCPELLSRGKHAVITRNHDSSPTCVLF